MSRDSDFFNNQYLVYEIAKKLHRQVRTKIFLEDLISIGNIGLLTALETHKKSDLIIRNYLRLRIKGTIIDYLRKIEGNSRQIVEAMTKSKIAYSALRSSLQREPSQKEISIKMGLGIESYHQKRGLSILSKTIKYEELLGGCDPFNNPENLVDLKLRVELVRREIDKLTPILKMSFEHERGERLREYSRRVGIEYPCLLWRRKQAIKILKENLSN